MLEYKSHYKFIKELSCFYIKPDGEFLICPRYSIINRLPSKKDRQKYRPKKFVPKILRCRMLDKYEYYNLNFYNMIIRFVRSNLIKLVRLFLDNKDMIHTDHPNPSYTTLRDAYAFHNNVLKYSHYRGSYDFKIYKRIFALLCQHDFVYGSGDGIQFLHYKYDAHLYSMHTCGYELDDKEKRLLKLIGRLHELLRNISPEYNSYAYYNQKQHQRYKLSDCIFVNAVDRKIIIDSDTMKFIKNQYMLNYKIHHTFTEIMELLTFRLTNLSISASRIRLDE